jgi:hypothetical protein
VEVIGWVIGVLVSVLVGWVIGKQRGRGDAGAALGLLGPIGWIIAALLPEEGRRCPECRGVVPREARRCKHCGADFAALVEPGRTFEPIPDEAHLRALLERQHGRGWYVIQEGKTPQGPLSAAQIKSLLQSGAIQPGARCARAGEDRLVPVERVA